MSKYEVSVTHYKFEKVMQMYKKETKNNWVLSIRIASSCLFCFCRLKIKGWWLKKTKTKPELNKTYYKNSGSALEQRQNC